MVLFVAGERASARGFHDSRTSDRFPQLQRGRKFPPRNHFKTIRKLSFHSETPVEFRMFQISRSNSVLMKIREQVIRLDPNRVREHLARSVPNSTTATYQAQSILELTNVIYGRSTNVQTKYPPSDGMRFPQIDSTPSPPPSGCLCELVRFGELCANAQLQRHSISIERRVSHRIEHRGRSDPPYTQNM